MNNFQFFSLNTCNFWLFLSGPSLCLLLLSSLLSSPFSLSPSHASLSLLSLSPFAVSQILSLPISLTCCSVYTERGAKST